MSYHKSFEVLRPMSSDFFMFLAHCSLKATTCIYSISTFQGDLIPLLVDLKNYDNKYCVSSFMHKMKLKLLYNAEKKQA